MRGKTIIRFASRHQADPERGRTVLALGNGDQFASRMNGGEIKADFVYNGHGMILTGRVSLMRMIVYRMVP